MSDPHEPLERLRSFDPGVTMPPMTPSDVRRRGDRLRRRNTSLAVVGGALAIALVATPLALLTRGGTDARTVDPAVTPLSETADVLAVDEVPTRDRLTPWRATAPDPTTLFCQPAALDTLGATDTVSGRFVADIPLPPGTTADPEAADVVDSQIRESVLQFEDATAAQAAYGTVTGWIEECAPDPTGSPASAPTLLSPDGGQAEWRQRIFAAPDVCVDCDAARFDLMGVARVDDRLVVVSFAEVGGPIEPEGLDATMNALFAAAIEKARPGVDEVPRPTTEAEAVAVIPDGFPIDRDLVAMVGDGGEKTGPGADATGVTFLDGWCGTRTWPPDAGLERLATSVSGPEYFQSRELVTFPSAQDAATVVDALRSAVVDCPVVKGATPADDTAYTLVPDDTGQNSATFSAIYATGLTGNSIYQFTQVGNAVLASVDSGEYSAGTAAAGADALTERNAPLVREMCGFTGAC